MGHAWHANAPLRKNGVLFSPGVIGWGAGGQWASASPLRQGSGVYPPCNWLPSPRRPGNRPMSPGRPDKACTCDCNHERSFYSEYRRLGLNWNRILSEKLCESSNKCVFLSSDHKQLLPKARADRAKPQSEATRDDKRALLERDGKTLFGGKRLQTTSEQNIPASLTGLPTLCKSINTPSF